MCSSTLVTNAEIEDFLQQAKKAIKAKNYSHYGRKKFIDLCAKMGKIPDDEEIFDVIYNLNYTNHFRGPSSDHDGTKPDEVWEFKSVLDNINIYIKIKIIESEGKKLHCFGFHEDEF